MDISTLLQLYPKLGKIPAPLQEILLSSASELRLKPGTEVFSAGDPCQNYLLILDGSVRVFRLSESGREIMLYRVEPGDTCILTTSCLLSGEDYPALAVCETPVHAMAIPRQAFQDTLAGSREFRDFVFQVYSRRISDLILLVEEVAFGRMDGRLAERLLESATDSKRLAMTHQELAAELGTVREVVSRLLKEFERRGFLRLHRGEIELLDRAALQALARKTLA